MYARILPHTVAAAAKSAHNGESIGLALMRVLKACLSRQALEETQTSATIAGSVRHVWASHIALRAAPDVMAPEVLRLQRGGLVELVPDGGAPVAHRATAARHDLCVTLNGHWRDVLAEGKCGWVFDGCLSRYPAPGACTAEELAYAAQVFSTLERGKGKRLQHKWNLAEHAGAAEVYWTHIAFDTSGERLAMAGQGATENLAVEGMPLRFNEALLWWLYFRRLA